MDGDALKHGQSPHVMENDMGANDLVMQRLSDTIAQLHTELVQQRQQRQRAFADAAQMVTEYGVIPNAGANVKVAPYPLMSGPVCLRRWLIYTGGTHTKLIMNSDEGDNSYQIPLAQGVTAFTCDVLFKPGDRPVILDTTGNVDLYIRVSGMQLPSVAMPL